MQNNKTPGERLKQWRSENKYSSILVADRIGVKDPTITRFENGQTQIKADSLKKLIEEFGLSINWLLTGEGNKKIDLTSEEKQLLNYYNKLDDSHKKDLLDIAKTFLPPADQEDPGSESTVSQKAG